MRCALPSDPRPRVLLADDYTRILTVLTQMLEPSCDVVGQAADGAQLLEAATRLRPDVVVVDVNLRDLDGLEACRRIKAATPHAQVVIFTADDDPALQGRAFELGAAAFVQKFRAADELLPAIRLAFGQGCAHRRSD